MNFDELVVTYGLEITLTCLAAIFLVGCIKVIFKKQFDKVEKACRKTIYETMSIVIAFGITAGWILIKNKCLGGPAFDWADFGKSGLVVYSATKVTYSLYENYKLRDLFQVIGKAVVGVLTHKKAKDEVKVLDSNEDDKNKNNVNVI